MDLRDLGRVIREERERMGLTHGQLASRAGLNSGTVRRIEKYGAMTMETFVMLSDGLGIAASRLMRMAEGKG